ASALTTSLPTAARSIRPTPPAQDTQAMPPVELLIPRYTFPTLHLEEQPDSAVYWMSMHADLQQRPGRACFRPELIDDILDYQKVLARRLGIEARNAPGGLAHVVLASSADSFNLGGDLALFCDAIRRHDR